MLERIVLHLDFFLSIVFMPGHFLLNLLYILENITNLVFIQQKCQLLDIGVIFVFVNFD